MFLNSCDNFTALSEYTHCHLHTWVWLHHLLPSLPPRSLRFIDLRARSRNLLSNSSVFSASLASESYNRKNKLLLGTIFNDSMWWKYTCTQLSWEHLPDPTPIPALPLYLSTGYPLTLCGQKYREEAEKRGGKRKHEKEKKMPAKTITTN